MYFEATVALRHLRSGRWQTVLTVAGVAVAVVVIIFITSLIKGVQKRFFGDLIGSIPHVTVKPPDPKPIPLAAISNPRSGLTISRAETQAQQNKTIDDAAGLQAQLERMPHVTAVVANVSGQAFLMRGSKSFGLSLSGADPRAFEHINHLQDDMVSGKWLDIGPDEIVIGYKLAEKANVVVGDRVRIESSEGVNQAFTVAGIFDTGLDVNDLSRAYVTLRSAQALFAMKQSVSSFWVQLTDPYLANDVADQVVATLPFDADSWMREQGEILDALRVQTSTSNMISAFSLFASMLGIASVLIVSVIQKSKQIGILKSMGARDRQILLIFAFEGLGIAVLGAIVGAGLSYGLLVYLSQLKREVRIGKIDELYPVILEPNIFLTAMLGAILATLVAALLPARRAAKVNPVDVIHGG